MELVTNLILTAVSVGIVLTHSIAAFKHFDSTEIQPGARMIMALVALTTIAFTVQIWTSTRPQLIAWCGIAIELASLALFVAAIRASRSAALKAAFTSHSPHTLLRTGPYGVLRHPFYTSYVLFWIGWTLALFNWWALPPTLILIVLYVLAARREEKKFDTTEMATQYAAYRAQTGFMWPRF